MKKYNISICFYQHPLALNEIYNWCHEHIKEIKFFIEYEDFIDDENDKKISCKKFLFEIKKQDSGKHEIIFCISSNGILKKYKTENAIDEIVEKLSIYNLDDLKFTKLLLFGAFKSEELKTISENFKI